MKKVSILIILAVGSSFLSGLFLGQIIGRKNKDKEDAELIKQAYKMGEMNGEIKEQLNKKN